MPRYSLELKKQIADDLAGASTTPGARKQIVDRWRQQLGDVSKDTVYRLAKKGGWGSGRTRRRDSGTSKAGVSDNYLLLITRVKRKSARQFGTKTRFIMDTETAMNVVADVYGERVSVTPDTINRLLRDREMSEKRLVEDQPFYDQRSDYPNHVHQVDASVQIQYRFFPGKGLKILPFNTQVNMNKIEKLQEIKTKIIRLIVCDHRTHCFFLCYVEQKGERTTDFIDALYAAWADKLDPGFPFAGIPKTLYSDKGSALGSYASKQLFAALGVEFIDHEAGNPRAKGSVERAMKLVETRFESMLPFIKPRDIRELNDEAYKWARSFQSRKAHSRYGKPRFDMFVNECRENQLKYPIKLPPDLSTFRALASMKPYTRIVTVGRRVKWNKNHFYVGDFAPPGSIVEVIPDLYNKSVVIVRLGDKQREFQIPRLDNAGFHLDAAVIGENFKRHPDTLTQRQLKAAMALPEPESPGQISYPKRKTYRLLKTKTFETEVPDAEVSTAAFKRKLVQILERPLTNAERDLIDSTYGEHILKSQCVALIEQFKSESLKAESEN